MKLERGAYDVVHTCGEEMDEGQSMGRGRWHRTLRGVHILVDNIIRYSLRSCKGTHPLADVAVLGTAAAVEVAV